MAHGLAFGFLSNASLGAIHMKNLADHTDLTQFLLKFRGELGMHLGAFARASRLLKLKQ
jgi:hypothetical protein